MPERPRRELGVESQIDVLDQIVNPERENNPEISMETTGKDELKKLGDTLRERNNSGEKSVVAVVRCWNKSEESLRGFIDRIKNMRQSMPEFQGVFVSINSDGDDDNKTTKALEQIISDEDDSTFPIIPIGVKNYTWTAGLNAPAAVLHKMAAKYDLDKENISVLNQSFDVEINDEQMANMSQRVKEGKPAITLRTSDGELPKGEVQKMIEVAKPLLRQDPPEEGYVAYLRNHPKLVALLRNTAALVSVKDIVDLGGYNPDANKYGGMEDHEFFMRLLLHGTQGEKIKLLRAFLDEKAWVAYRDPAWEGSSYERKSGKRVRERNADILVTSSILEQKKQDHFIVPPEKRDFKF